MTEDEMLYQALSSPLGLVIRADRQRVAAACKRLSANDPAVLDLLLIGPDPAGSLYVLRADAARASGF